MKTESYWISLGYWKCVYCNRINEPERVKCRYCKRKGNIKVTAVSVKAG